MSKHLYELLVDWALSHGARSIKDLPGCWEHSWTHAGNRWFVAAHAGPGERATSTGASIAPGSFWIECNGWPAGYVSMNGCTVARGAAINEKVLRAALRSGQGDAALGEESPGGDSGTATAGGRGG